MPRGPAPAWKARKEPLLDDHVLASVSAAEMNAENGRYGELIYAGCPDEERALEIKRALFRAAKRQGYSISAHVEKAGQAYQVRFVAIDKLAARRYIVEKYGPDRTAWPYNPRQRGI
jgi:hypothetical protein